MLEEEHTLSSDYIIYENMFLPKQYKIKLDLYLSPNSGKTESIFRGTTEDDNSHECSSQMTGLNPSFWNIHDKLNIKHCIGYVFL